MKIYRMAFLFLMLVGYAFGGTPTRGEVLKAITILEDNFVSTQAADAAKVIVTFAQESDDVTVTLGPLQIPWLDEKWGLNKDQEQACKTMLLAAYLAGNIRYQLNNPKPKDDPYPGWIFVIDAYHQLQRKAGFRSPAIDTLADMDAKSTLRQRANEAMKR